MNDWKIELHNAERLHEKRKLKDAEFRDLASKREAFDQILFKATCTDRDFADELGVADKFVRETDGKKQFHKYRSAFPDKITSSEKKILTGRAVAIGELVKWIDDHGRGKVIDQLPNSMKKVAMMMLRESVGFADIQRVIGKHYREIMLSLSNLKFKELITEQWFQVFSEPKSSSSTKESQLHDGWEFQTSEATFLGKTINLSGMKYELLKILVEADSRLTILDLIDLVWRPTRREPGFKAVRSTVSSLNKALRKSFELSDDKKPIRSGDRNKHLWYEIDKDLANWIK